MKKIKLLTPILGVTALASTVAPIATITSCSNGSTPTVEASISIGVTTLTLKPGESIELKANVTGTSKEVTWNSDAEAVATVTGGKILAIADGTANITATANGKTATCTVTVASEPIVPTQTDKDFVDKINDLAQYGTEYSAPHKVITALKDNGYDVLAFKLSNPEMEFAFDASVKKFIIMSGDEIKYAPTGYKMNNQKVVFKFVNNKTFDSTCTYGQYLLDNFEYKDPTVKFTFQGSIDVGNNTNIKYMSYEPTAANADNNQILIRTYCEYIDIKENSNTIYHMGESNNINVYGTDSTNVCNYMELGRTAYLYLKNVSLQIAQISSADRAQIDVLESELEDSTVTLGKLFHEDYVTMFIGKEIEGVSETKHYETTTVSTLDELGRAITGNMRFIRLADDITFDKTITAPIQVYNKSFVLDLAGKQLIDKAENLTKGQALIDIQAETANSSLMFIDSCRQGSFTLNDHNINIEGNINDSTRTATLYLEGANIVYNATANRNGAVEVGRVKTSGSAHTGLQYSRVYMFGGKIEAKTDSSVHEECEVSGLYANDDAYIQVVYGAIYSSTNCIRTNGQYSGAYIDIVDGTFKTSSKTVGECIYLPQGKLNITGGTYEGHTCLGIRGGNTNISGGYFHATGEHTDIDKAASAGSGLGGDGSVICVELENGASETAYGTNPSITISNSTLYSENSYIMQIFRNNATEDVNQFLEVDFFGGVYYYATDVEKPTYNGIRIGSATGLSDTNYRIYQQSGSWIKVK